MNRRYAMLKKIENNRAITPESDSLFISQLQISLLLTLKEKGQLSFMQFKHAEEKLRQQRRNNLSRIWDRQR